MDSDKSIGQISPKIKNPDGELQYLCKLIPTPNNLIFKRFFPKQFCKKKWKKNSCLNLPAMTRSWMFHI